MELIFESLSTLPDIQSIELNMNNSLINANKLKDLEKYLSRL